MSRSRLPTGTAGPGPRAHAWGKNQARDCRPSRDGRGVSMVELLVAVALMAAAVLPLYSMFYQSTAQIAAGQDEGLIQNIGTAFCCQVRRFFPSLLPQTQTAVALPFDPSGKYHLGGMASVNWIYLPSWENRQVSLSYAVTKVASIPRNNRLITLKIHWQTPKGKPMLTTFAEMIASE